MASEPKKKRFRESEAIETSIANIKKAIAISTLYKNRWSVRIVEAWQAERENKFENQEREETQGIDKQTTCYRCEGTTPQIYANLRRQSVIRVQRRDTLLKFVDRRQRVRHYGKLSMCHKKTLSKKS